MLSKIWEIRKLDMAACARHVLRYVHTDTYVHGECAVSLEHWSKGEGLKLIMRTTRYICDALVPKMSHSLVNKHIVIRMYHHPP